MCRTMKFVSQFCFVLMSILLFLTGCKSSGYDPNRPLVTSPCVQHPLDEINTLLDAATASNKPIVIYVHGRGKEPLKSAPKKGKSGIIQHIEEQNGCHVVMVNWDSAAPVLVFGRPVDRAIDAADLLKQVVKSVGLYRRAHSSPSAKPITLLAHSMGNIVLAAALKDDPNLLRDDQGEAIFDNILITESDEDAENHTAWAQHLRAKSAILMTFNETDWVLARANSAGHHPLGRINPADLEQRVASISYLNLTGTVGTRHRVFVRGGMESQVNLCLIINAMLNGKAPPLIQDQTVRQNQTKPNVYALIKKTAQPSDECFHHVEPETEEEE